MILITVFSIALLIALAYKKDFLIAIPVVMTGVALVVRLFIFLNLYNELIILLCVVTIGAIVLSGTVTAQYQRDYHISCYYPG